MARRRAAGAGSPRWLAPAELGGPLSRACGCATTSTPLHGHYADRHTTVPMLERLGAGVTALDRGRAAGAGRAAPRITRRRSAPIRLGSRARPARGRRACRAAPTGPPPRRGARWRARRRSRTAPAGDCAWRSPVAVAALNRAGSGPLSADLSPAALRRLGLARSARCSCVSGHALPTSSSDTPIAPARCPATIRREWRTVTGARLSTAAAGCDEPAFLGAEPARSPYRAGSPSSLATAPSTGPLDSPGAAQPARSGGQPGGEADGVADDPVANLSSSTAAVLRAWRDRARSAPG